ncbi:MAG TPA: hypothetical protein PKE06_07240 [Flavilitoribacter sp.]|nr:hypothetical protein [Flavilitoribacter sp.]HMQ87486.1 hypothetical protein [Flavilitoribacter sp.]
MKYLYLTLSLSLLFLSDLQSQCTPNTPLGSTINQFNWQQPTFLLHVIEDNSQIVPVIAPSPFYTINFSGQGNVDHLSAPVIKDYQVEDGWELLYVNFGTQSIGVAEPSFALYNRYDGLARFFFWLTANEGNTYNSAMLKIKHGSILPPKNSAVFENINSPAHALDAFDKGLSVERHNAYEESVGTWVIAEFATAFDPCSCNHATEFEVKPFLVSVSSVDLTIEGTSITTPLMSGGEITNQNGFIEAIGDINAIFQSVSSLTEKGQKTYKNLAAFQNEVTNILAPLVTPTNSPIIGAIPDFLDNVPFIGLGLQILDFLVGGGKSTSASTVTSFMERHQFSVTGNLTTIAPYQSARFYTPGSDRTGFDDSARYTT